MTIHICRDFQTLPSSSSPGVNLYLITAFLQHIMSYGVISNVNFDINSSSYTLAQGSAASINVMTGSEYIVYVPSGTYVSSSSDIDRILALKSSLYPTHNSGLFRVTNVTSSIHGVGFVIDYRSSEFPPNELLTLSWRLYEKENNLPNWLSGSNGSFGYNSSGAANNSRIMLVSPIGFNLRLCLESQEDIATTNPSGFSITPGLGAISNADYDNVEGCLHAPLWFNSSSSLYRGMSVGLTPATSSGQWAFTAIGDTTNNAVVCINKNLSFLTGGNGFCAFGIPEDEDNSSKLIDKLFVIGYSNTLSNLTWHSGYHNQGHSTGIAWSKYGFPSPVVLSSYADIRNLDPHIRAVSVATDNPFINATELSDIEIIAGVMTSSVSFKTEGIISTAPRRVGRLPLLRQGRSNYQQWSLTPDKSWYHTLDGIFVPWTGPHLSGTITGSSNAILVSTSSYSESEGIEFFELNPSMADPYVERTIISTDKDANRFKKTYSFYRQQPNTIAAVKCGSNIAKP